MSYYITIRPRDAETVTIHEFRQRLLDQGLEPHPDADRPESMYGDTSVINGVCMITIGPQLPDLSMPIDLSKLKIAIQASARISWSFSRSTVEKLAAELYVIAQAVNADLIGPDKQVLGPDAPQVFARDFARFMDTMTVRRHPRPAKPAG